jgi:hypothetical protein
VEGLGCGRKMKFPSVTSSLPRSTEMEVDHGDEADDTSAEPLWSR